MGAPLARLEQLEPGIARLLAPNPGPFTFTGTWTFLVGHDEVAVIDPGPDLPDHVEALLAALAGRRLAAILCTHTHADHSPAARPLARATGAAIVGCAPLAPDDMGVRGDASFDHDYSADRVLGDGDWLEVDGRRITAVATPGHTSNHLCFASGDALFTGDHVMGWSTSVIFPPDGDMGDYMASLEKLGRRDDRIHYPAHGEPVEEPQQRVRDLVAHRRQREAQIVSLVAERPRSIADIIAAAYPGLDPRLVAAAGGSVLAHLLDLERRGLVGRDGEQWTRTA